MSLRDSAAEGLAPIVFGVAAVLVIAAMTLIVGECNSKIEALTTRNDKLRAENATLVDKARAAREECAVSKTFADHVNLAGAGR